MTRPVLIFAHRTNTPEWLDHAFTHKANALESDIYKGMDGQLWAAHDSISPGTKIEALIAALQRHLDADAEGRFVMWMLDLKNLNRDDVQTVRELCAGLPLDVLRFYSVTMATIAALEPHVADFSPSEGVNYDANWFSSNESPENAVAWKDRNHVQNFMYSAGVAEVHPGGPSLWARLEQAAALRHQRRDFGVYSWTWNDGSNAKAALQKYELNGVMGNMNHAFGDLPREIMSGGVPGVRMAVRADGPGAACWAPPDKVA